MTLLIDIPTFARARRRPRRASALENGLRSSDPSSIEGCRVEGNVVARRDEDDGDVDARRAHPRIASRSPRARHVHIENRAIRMASRPGTRETRRRIRTRSLRSPPGATIAAARCEPTPRRRPRRCRDRHLSPGERYGVARRTETTFWVSGRSDSSYAGGDFAEFDGGGGDAAVATPIPSRPAMCISSALVLACIRSMIRARWNLTVCSTTPNSAAICLLSFPAASASSTSRSRGVRLATRWRISAESASARRAAASCSIALRTAARSACGLHGLGQEIRRARLDRPHRHRNVAVPADEHDRQRLAPRGQPALQFESVQAGHGHIEHQAPIRPSDRAVRETLLQTRTSRRSIRLPETRATALSARLGSSSTIKTVCAEAFVITSRPFTGN